MFNGRLQWCLAPIKTSSNFAQFIILEQEWGTCITGRAEEPELKIQAPAPAPNI